MKVKENTIQLIKEGISLNKISKLTGIRKSTLYYHYKKIKGKKYKGIVLSKNQEEIGEFIGIFAGDGNYCFDNKKYHYKIRIYTGVYEVGYRIYLSKFFYNLFRKKPITYNNKDNNVEINAYYSKEIYELIKKYLLWVGKKTYSVRLKNLENLNTEFLIGFIRGLFDTDGSVYQPKNRVSWGSASKDLAIQVKLILEKMNMPVNFYENKNKNFWCVSLHGNNSKRFMGVIKPGNPNKILSA